MLSVISHAVYEDGSYGGPPFDVNEFRDEYQSGSYQETRQLYDDAQMEMDMRGLQERYLWFESYVDPQEFSSSLTVDQCWKEDLESGEDHFQNLVEWLEEMDKFTFTAEELSGYDRSSMASIKQLLWDWDFDSVGDEWDDWGPIRWQPEVGEWERCRRIVRENERYPITVLFNGRVLDGAHRLAVAIYERQRSYPALVGFPEEILE